MITGPGEAGAALLPIRELVDLGPAIFVDSARFVARRAQDSDASASRVLYEAFHAYFLPQLDQLDDAGARRLYDLISPAFASDEQPSLRRVIRNVLGSRPRLPPDSDGEGGAELVFAPTAEERTLRAL